ncbi:MAG: MFS transporter [Sulfurimonas sp.]|nr:MFS transporter [Sulfurimonas sp.]
MLSTYKNYLLYALPALPLALLGLPLYVYLPSYYAQDVELGLFEVGIVLLVARLFDMISDPLIGYWSDRYFPRKALMFVGLFFLLGGFYYLSHPIAGATSLWLFSFSMLVYFGWSLISIPYYALGADLGESYKQNSGYASFRELFNISGVLLALLLPYFLGVADNPAKSLTLMFSVIVILLPIILLIFFLSVHAQRVKSSLHSLKEVYTHFVCELKSSKYLFGAFFLNSFANALPATLFLLYVALVIGAKESSGILLIVYFVSGILALPFWYMLAAKFSKKRAWIVSIINAVFFFSFVPFLGEGDFNYFLIITIFSGMSLGADMALPASMQADVAQNASSPQKQLGGTLFGFFAMLTKLSLAVGVGVSFAILGLFDFSTTQPSESSLLVLSLLYGALPVILKLLAIFVLSKHKEKEYHAIN